MPAVLYQVRSPVHRKSSSASAARNVYIASQVHYYNSDDTFRISTHYFTAGSLVLVPVPLAGRPPRTQRSLFGATRAVGACRAFLLSHTDTLVATSLQ